MGNTTAELPKRGVEKPPTIAPLKKHRQMRANVLACCNALSSRLGTKPLNSVSAKRRKLPVVIVELYPPPFTRVKFVLWTAATKAIPRIIASWESSCGSSATRLRKLISNHRLICSARPTGPLCKVRRMNWATATPIINAKIGTRCHHIPPRSPVPAASPKSTTLPVIELAKTCPCPTKVKASRKPPVAVSRPATESCSVCGTRMG